MNRTVEIRLDSKSWGWAPIPPELVACVGAKDIDVRVALLFTALCTRPPVVYGFDLSDFWAWLRYLPAISDTKDLRLRLEWSDVDPHQKTVLSDELGVGFTTALVAELFKCGEFVDTKFVVKALGPTNFKLRKSAKRGPAKAPDFSAAVGGGRDLVLECKGTQDSDRALDSAIAKGQGQKNNLIARGSNRVANALVAGLFIPQFRSPASATIKFADPTWEELDELLQERSVDQIDGAIARTAIAKNMAVCGSSAMASWFLDESLSGSRPGSMALQEASLRMADQSGDGFRTVFDVPLYFPEARIGRRNGRASFLVSSPRGLSELVTQGTVSPASAAEAYRHDMLDMHWHMSSHDEFAEIGTPLGFRYRLKIEH